MSNRYNPLSLLKEFGFFNILLIATVIGGIFLYLLLYMYGRQYLFLPSLQSTAGLVSLFIAVVVIAFIVLFMVASPLLYFVVTVYMGRYYDYGMSRSRFLLVFYMSHPVISTFLCIIFFYFKVNNLYLILAVFLFVPIIFDALFFCIIYKNICEKKAIYFHIFLSSIFLSIMVSSAYYNASAFLYARYSVWGTGFNSYLEQSNLGHALFSIWFSSALLVLLSYLYVFASSDKNKKNYRRFIAVCASFLLAIGFFLKTFIWTFVIFVAEMTGMLNYYSSFYEIDRGFPISNEVGSIWYSYAELSKDKKHFILNATQIFHFGNIYVLCPGNVTIGYNDNFNDVLFEAQMCIDLKNNDVRELPPYTQFGDYPVYQTLFDLQFPFYQKIDAVATYFAISHLTSVR